MAALRFSLRLVSRSLLGRRVPSLLVSSSIAIATSVVVTLLCLSIDVQSKLTRQLAEFGANVALVPRGREPTFPAAAAAALVERLPPHSIASYVLYSTATLIDRKSAPLLVAGVEPATILDVVRVRVAGRSIPASGDLPSLRIPALAGGRLARQLGLTQGTVLPLLVHDHRVEAEIVGLMSTGENEEDQLWVPLRRLEALVGLEGRRSAVLLRVPGRPEEVARAVAALPTRSASHDIEPKLLRRVAASAAAALAKIRGLLMVLSVLVAIASVLSAGMVLMEQAVERRGEVGLMKSLGAGNGEVASLVLAHAAGLGLSGGLVGTAVGIGIADLLERAVFGAALALPWLAAPIGVVVGLTLAMAASALPLRASLRVAPALALRETPT